MRATLKSPLQGLMIYTLCLFSLPAASAQLAAQLLVYRVTEPGAEPYISRILVIPGSLRMDQGQGDDGFVLLDRKKKTIYSVNSADKTILQISPLARVKNLPEDMKLEAKIIQDQKLPELPGNKTEYWRFYVNGELCRSAMVAPGLMQEATTAYGEYLDLLAFQHLATLQAIPEELQEPCDLAVHVFDSLAVIDKGLPIREWLEQGRLQELIDYRERFEVPVDSFTLPEGYRRNSLGDLRSGE